MIKGQSSSTVSIDIEQLQNSSEINLKDRCICRVDLLIRELYKNDYEPLVVSIGPYHHGKGILQEMENNKWKCLEYILKANPQETLDDYIKLLRKLYPLLRGYYPDESQMKINKFVRIFLLDVCFILMSLYGADWPSDSTNSDKSEDPKQQMDMWHDYYFVIHDLLLIENQIPVIIVTRIYELLAGKESTTVLPTERIAILVEQILSNYPISIDKLDRPKDFYHLLHLCHMYLKPSLNYDFTYSFDNDDQPLNVWYQAVQYHMAGVKIEKREFDINNPHSLLDVRFVENVLEIAYLHIDENTRTIFKNLIAFEQASPHFGKDNTAYIVFMSELVSNGKDAALLFSKGIIVHHLQSNEEVSNIFRELCDGVDFDYFASYYLRNTCQRLGAYYKSHMMSWKCWLRRIGYAIQESRMGLGFINHR